MIRVWLRDLLMGARFAVTGGRSGWTRTLLTAVGVGLGVAVLLLAASIPSAMTAGDVRQDARSPQMVGEDEPREAGQTWLAWADTVYRGESIAGMLLQPVRDRDRAATPPGVERMPAPGEMVVSPALGKLLEHPSQPWLAERFGGAKVVGTIGDEGLHGPSDLRFYLGTDKLSERPGAPNRAEAFGAPVESKELPPELILLTLVMLVVFLMPIMVFVGVAVRFGSESRDRRLAALRLVGADQAMTARTAAGEALVGAVLGLLIGGWVFLVGRSIAGRVELFGISVFPSDIAPASLLAVSVVLLVPLTAVLVTLLAMRKVAISPLGVTREGADRGRRLWWRLAVLLLGVALLAFFVPKMRDGGDTETYGIVAGLSFTLIGLTAVLPWGVERMVHRMHGGSLSWQLATRRIQLNSSLAARSVSGVTVAVAGAVALQMLYGAVGEADRSHHGRDPGTPRLTAFQVVDDDAQARSFAERFALDGVRVEQQLVAGAGVYERTEPDEEGWREEETVTVADCATLGRLLDVDDCREGDAFYAPPLDSEGTPEPPEPGERIDLTADAEQARSADPTWWTIPDDLRLARSQQRSDGGGWAVSGLLVTPSVLKADQIGQTHVELVLAMDREDDALVEQVRSLVPVSEPASSVALVSYGGNSEEFQSISNGLMLGAVLVMLLIGASMIVSTVEQLRERKRQLSVLVAFGTKRSTLGASVLWQTAIPVMIGMALAVSGGVATGWLLLRMMDDPVVDWFAFLPLLGAGIGLIALVTLASLPSLWRMMRPDGLRTE